MKYFYLGTYYMKLGIFLSLGAGLVGAVLYLVLETFKEGEGRSSFSCSTFIKPILVGVLGALMFLILMDGQL